MAINLAGVELLAPHDPLSEWIEQNIPQGEAFPWLRASWPGHTLDRAGIGVPGYRMPTTFRVGEFFWPQGASRFAYGAFAATSDQADAVRAAANGSGDGDAPAGSTTTPVPLVLTSPGNPSQEILVAPVTVLRIVPLTQFVPTNNGTPSADDDFDPTNLLILVVVDARYYWQTSPCPDFQIEQYGLSNPASEKDPDSPNYGKEAKEPISWQECIEDCATALGVTIDVDDIPKAYLFPDPSLNLAGYPIGPVLDALAANVGMRFVANMDGTYAVQSVQTAAAARAADDNSDVGQARTLRAGGNGFADTL